MNPHSKIESPHAFIVYTGQQTKPSQQMVKLRLQASGLPKMDFLSKSDPMCVCFEKVSGSWKEVGRTETKKNTHNPAWDTTFKLKNSSQDLKFEVYDSDSKSTNLKKKDYMGALEVNLNLVVEKKR